MPSSWVVFGCGFLNALALRLGVNTTARLNIELTFRKRRRDVSSVWVIVSYAFRNLGSSSLRRHHLITQGSRSIYVVERFIEPAGVDHDYESESIRRRYRSVLGSGAVRTDTKVRWTTIGARPFSIITQSVRSDVIRCEPSESVRESLPIYLENLVLKRSVLVRRRVPGFALTPCLSPTAQVVSGPT